MESKVTIYEVPDYISKTIDIAIELGYGNDVIVKLAQAKTPIEADRIMKTAREALAERYTEISMGRKGL